MPPRADKPDHDLNPPAQGPGSLPIKSETASVAGSPVGPASTIQGPATMTPSGPVATRDPLDATAGQVSIAAAGFHDGEPQTHRVAVDGGEREFRVIPVLPAGAGGGMPQAEVSVDNGYLTVRVEGPRVEPFGFRVEDVARRCVLVQETPILAAGAKVERGISL